jgi:hypothetical protein
MRKVRRGYRAVLRVRDQPIPGFVQSDPPIEIPTKRIFCFGKSEMNVFLAAYLAVNIRLQVYRDGELFDEGVTIQDPHNPRILIEGLNGVIPLEARHYRISGRSFFSSTLSACWLLALDEVRIHTNPTALLRQIREIQKLPNGSRF